MAHGMEGSPERWTYDVFLSFRGEDVRKNFLSHLYDGFKAQGITPFKDDVELERGENISKQLLKVIETSKVLVVVLSKDYASSAWCLDELVHIMKCHESNPSQLVFPIFYNVDPSHIRRQKGSYAESFSRHKGRYPSHRIKDWRVALTKVANKYGWDLRDRDEAESIKEITREISNRFPCSYQRVPSHVVCIRSRLDNLSSLLSIGSDEVRVIGICGMGGIGKTTLAKVAFNEFSHLFDGSSFLENFKDHAKKPKGKTRLQHQLLSDILKRNDIEVRGLDHAVKERLRNKRVLIVVDDVDDIQQLDSASAAIDLRYFGRGSRIIITTRDMHLLELPQVKGIYLLKEFNSGESLELLSWRAFGTNEPPEAFLQLSKKVVAYCAGLPLALEVLGAHLRRRSIPEWEGVLESLKTIPDSNIQATLKISFDALNRRQKDVFLDIACFFIGMDSDYVACILDGCNLCPDIVLKVLMERCLITVSGDSIMMHDLLRDMGREIVRNIPSKNCGGHSRLWKLEDVIRVLTRKTGTDAVEGLSLKAKVTDVQYFEVEAFANMQELRLLQLSYVHLHGSYEHFPKDIRCLSWHGFSSESLPTNLSLRSLVALDMQYSNLKQFWKAPAYINLKQFWKAPGHPQPANMLKHLDLSHSVYLRETPDFSYFPNVEKLLLVNCKSLVVVHKSVGILHKKLVLLNLSSCIVLDALPEELYKLKSLETLLLSHCSKLERLDAALGELESLITLVADFTALKEIPSSINQLKKLKRLSLKGCNGLLNENLYPEKSHSASPLLPISLSGLSCLSTLSLAYCNLSDDMIPKDIESLCFLQKLDLGGNNFCNLQTDFASLTNLFDLRLTDCSKLQSIFSLPRSLVFFNGRNCISLERTPDLSECSGLYVLDLSGCFQLVETPGIQNLKMISFCNLGTSKTTIKMILQDWLQRNHNCIYLQGYSLPDWVSFKGEMLPFSFTVPETQNSDLVVGFTLWTRFVSLEDGPPIPRSITVKNLTRGSTWTHSIEIHQVPFIHSNLLTNDFRIETGDHMEVDVGCDDYLKILETGFDYNARDSPDCSFGDIQIPDKDDNIFHINGDGDSLRCLRPMFEQNPLQAVVHYMRNPWNGGMSDLYACSIFPDIFRNQKNNQPVVEESHDRPHRKMRMCLRKILGAIGFLTLAVVLGKYGKPLRLIHRRLVDEKDVEKD